LSLEKVNILELQLVIDTPDIVIDPSTVAATSSKWNRKFELSDKTDEPIFQKEKFSN